MSAATLPNDFSALREPKIGDQLAALGVLERMAIDQAAAKMRHAPTVPMIRTTPLIPTGDPHVRRDRSTSRDDSRTGVETLSLGGDRSRDAARYRHAGRRPGLVEDAAKAPGRGKLALGILFAAAVAALAYWHWKGRLSGFALEPVNLIMFGAVAWFMTVAHMHRDVIAGPEESRVLDRKRLTVVVPLYNEDLATVREMLGSLAAQTRLPQRVHLVNDGTPLAKGPDGREHDEVRAEVNRWRVFAPASVEIRYDRIPNSGKRHAQAVAFRADPDADVFVTVDSDTVLDPEAFERGMAPFSQRRVTAVAGLLLGLNYRANLLTRLVDLGFVSSFLIGRSSWAVLSSVTVNCGGLAFYRADVIRKYLPAYLTQTVMGRPVMFGDDRMLTTYALLEGKTCFQQGAVGRTLLPANMSHLVRQRVRWWRSWYWGNMWIIQRFPITRAVWWLVAWQFTSFLLWTVTWPAILIAGPLEHERFPWQFFAYMAVLGWVRAVRFLTVRHPSRTFASQFASFALAPVAGLLSLYICSVLQYAGLFTFGKTGWGTRQSVEVGMEGVAR